MRQVTFKSWISLTLKTPVEFCSLFKLSGSKQYSYMPFCLCPSFVHLILIRNNVYWLLLYVFSPLWTALTFSKVTDAWVSDQAEGADGWSTKLHCCIGSCTRVFTQACTVPWQALPSSIRRYPVWQVHWTNPLAIWHFWEQPPLFWLQLPSLERGPVCRAKHNWCHRLICYK